MDFTLSSDQIFIKDTLRRFMQRDFPREKAHALDEEGVFPADFLPKIAGLGFCSLTVPEAYEGSGQDMLGAALAAEEIATISPGLAALYASVTLRGGQVVTALGSEDQKRRLLPELAAGGRLFSFALDSEPADSGATFTRQGETFTLDGRCGFTSLATFCDTLVVQARSSPQAGTSSLFVVPARAAGVHIHSWGTVGYRGAGSGEVVLDGVKLGAADLLGGAAQLDQGRTQADYLKAVDQLAAAALSLGLAQGAYAYTVNYARERAQFGQTILQFEAVEHLLVELAVAIQSARWLLYNACWLVDAGKPFALEAGMAALQAREAARQAGLRSVHILGGYGYMAEYDAQRYFRDSLVPFSEGLPGELLKNHIGALLGLGTEQ